MAYAEEIPSGRAYDMSQTCRILSKMLLDFIDDDASRQRNELIKAEYDRQRGIGQESNGLAED